MTFLSGFYKGHKESLKEKFKIIEMKKSCVIPQEDTQYMEYKNHKITKRTDGRWMARYKLNGKYNYVYDKTQKGCYDKLKTKLKVIKKEEIITSSKLNSWINKWIEIYKVNKIKETTLNKIKSTINKYITNSIGNLDITKIKPLEIENLLNSLNGGRLKQLTYTYLSDIFNKAFMNGIIKENIMQLIKKPKHIKKNGKALDNNEEFNFVNICKQNQYGDFFLILLYQGFRRGELLALENTDIDFNKKTISITKAINELGKISTPKTQNSIREVPIFKDTLPILLKYKNIKGRLFNFTKEPIQNAFVKIMKELNLTGFTIHSLRHTFVTRWTERGANSKLIQKWVGHGSNIITENIYTKINKDFEKKFLSEKDK